MDFCRIADDVTLGKNVKIFGFVNAYGCTIGDNTKVGTFVEIQKNATIGANCKISSHTFICEGVDIEDNVFIGHNVTFTNDRHPKAATAEGQLLDESQWQLEKTRICKGASIGSGVTILCGITIGAGAMIGAGSLVLKDVPAGETWAGHPAKKLE